MYGPQLLVLLVEALTMALLTLGLFRARTVLGLTPLYIVLGGFQYLDATLNMSVQIMPGFAVNPGSMILFSSTLVTVLLVYVKDDAIEARKLVYGLVLANAAISLMSLLIGWQLSMPGATAGSATRAEFVTGARIAMIGTTLLFFDVIGIILLYEFVSRFIRSLWTRFFIALVTIAALDTTLFSLIVQYNKPNLRAIVASAIAGKALTALFNATVYTAYLRWVEPQTPPVGTGDVGDVFHALTYRQKYEQVRLRMTRDALTGLYNRGYFDEALPTALAHARRYGEAVSLLLIDADHFKAINDRFFHAEGDRALRLIARTLDEIARAADVPCRYGGDEFVIILAHTPRTEAIAFAERFQASLRERCADETPAFPWTEVTTTIGVATYPTDGDLQAPEDLLRVADRRLYSGKQAGRNRVSSSSEPPTVPRIRTQAG